jgi:menaquinone-9 beta-reductase
MYDLIVIGGGPAGASAAITAARNGAKVLLLERGRFPRHKVCGEFISPESLALLGNLLDSSCVDLLGGAPRISKARIFLDGRILRAPIEPAAASVARFDLDGALWDSAERCGVDARQQVTAQNVNGSGPFVITTSIGEFEARVVVNAAGRWSNLRAPVATNSGDGEKWIGLKAHFAESSPSLSVDLYFFQGGYCGVQPVVSTAPASDGRVNACAMVRADVASTLPEVFLQHPALRERSAHWKPLTGPIGVAPLLFAGPQTYVGKMLLAGDAAGFVDPFVGDGISLALRSGALAADCLVPFFRGKVSLDCAVRHYSDQYQRQFAPIFRSSSKIRRMLLLPRGLRSPIVSLLANSPVVTRFLVRATR